MSQLGTGPSERLGPKAAGNVYTVLTFIAMVALLVGIAGVWYRGYDLFGMVNPFQVVQP